MAPPPPAEECDGCNDPGFNGIGPVITIKATCSLSERFALYAELRQSVLFGENVDKSGGHSSTTDTIGAMTKIGAGVQANFNFSAIEAFVPALGPT